MVRPVASGIPTEPGAPQWFQRFVARLSDFYQTRYPSGPTTPFACLSTEAPAANLTPFAVALFTDIPTLVFSNGTAWVRADGSAI